MYIVLLVECGGLTNEFTVNMKVFSRYGNIACWFVTLWLVYIHILIHPSYIAPPDDPYDPETSTVTTACTKVKYIPIPGSNITGGRFPAPTNIRQCSQEERVNHVKAFCDLSYYANSGSHKYPHSRSFLGDHDKFLYCWMSKAGSTALKNAILQTKGFNRTEMITGNLNPAHSEWSLRTYGYRYMKHVKSFQEKKHIVGSYFNMMGIRHPLDRLVSYYRDKIVDMDRGSAHPGRQADILRAMRPDKFKNNSELSNMEHPQLSLGAPTFVEFITWMHKTKTMDEHWNLIVDACNPCAHRWDAIIRVETIAQDSKLFLEKIRSTKHNINVQHSHRNAFSKFYTSKILPEYEKLDKWIMEYLMNMYREDMEMFGYGWDKDTNTMFCRIETENGPCC